MKIDLYTTFVFDCDGVVLNSNKIKTQAFYDAARTYGHDSAQALMDYHVNNGGISRYAKFEYFFTDILQKPVDADEFDTLLERFADEVKSALMQCDVAEGLIELRAQTKQAKWLIVSGGDQAELREVFEKRELFGLFDGGIFGSPDTKDVILKREIQSHNISSPALFLGDSRYDFQAAQKAGLDFLFLTQWTEVKDWKVWCEQSSIQSVLNLKSLVA